MYFSSAGAEDEAMLPARRARSALPAAPNPVRSWCVRGLDRRDLTGSGGSWSDPRLKLSGARWRDRLLLLEGCDGDSQDAAEQG